MWAAKFNEDALYQWFKKENSIIESSRFVQFMSFQTYQMHAGSFCVLIQIDIRNTMHFLSFL